MCRGPDRDRSWFVSDPRMEISKAAARLARNLAEASLRAAINAGSASGLNRPGSDATRGLGDPTAFWPRQVGPRTEAPRDLKKLTTPQRDENSRVHFTKKR